MIGERYPLHHRSEVEVDADAHVTILEAGDRQRDRRRGARTRLALDYDFATVRIDDAFHDRQSQSRPGVWSLAASVDVPIEDVGEQIGSDSRTSV